jgi:hypothetical protein
MKPEISFKCANYDCELYEKEVSVKDQESYFIRDYCSKCYKKGNLRVSHKGVESDSINDFYAVILQMAKEYHLLKKLIDKNLAEKEDEERFKEVYEIIKDLECTGCGQKFIDHEH